MKLNIKNKILIPILSIFMIIYFVTIYIVITTMYNNSRATGMEIIKSKANYSSTQITEMFSREVNVSKALSFIFSKYNRISEGPKEKLYLDVSKQIMKEYPDFLSLAINRQLFTVDNDWKHKYGRVRYLSYRDGENLSMEIKTLEMKGEDSTNMNGYYGLHLLNKRKIIEPYYYSFDGVDSILMTTVCAPIQNNSEFTGLVAIDISLKHINDYMESIEQVFGSNVFLLSSKGTYIYHSESERIGKSLSRYYKETDDKYRITEKIKHGKSIAFYDHGKDGEEYYVYFAPVSFDDEIQSWSVGVAVPVSEILKTIRSTALIIIIVGIIGFFIVFFTIIYITNTISKPIVKSVKYTKQIAAGNLKAKLEIKGRQDEIGELSENMKIMTVNLKSIIEKVKETSDTVNANASKLIKTSIKVSEGANLQASSAEEVSASMEEIISVVEQNSENAITSSKLANKSASYTKLTVKSAVKSAELMRAVAERISAIDDIAFQTNILSLNSAIEASHAGTLGKGFSVVAKEVGKLAAKSKQMAKEITELSKNSITVTKKSEKLLNSLLPEIEKTAQFVNEIADSTKEQKNGANQVSSSINNLSEVIQTNTESSYEMTKNAKDMQKHARELLELISYFTTD